MLDISHGKSRIGNCRWGRKDSKQESWLKNLKRFPEKDERSRSRGKYKYSTKEELIDYLRRFYEKYGRLPMEEI